MQLKHVVGNEIPICDLLDRLIRDVQSVDSLDKTPTVIATQQFRNLYSNTLRVGLNTECGRQNYYVKLPFCTAESRDEVERRLASEFAILASLHRSFADEPALSVVVPIAFYPDLLALVTIEAPGPTLQQLINTYSKRWRSKHHYSMLSRYVQFSARWLRQFQQCTDGGQLEFDVQSIHSYCDERMELLCNVESSGVDRSLRDHVNQFIWNKGTEIPRSDNWVAGRHNDFAPHNMIARPDGLCVLDFTMFDAGPVLFDVCRFWHRLELMKQSVLHSSKLLNDLQHCFLTEYGVQSVNADVFLLARLQYTITALWSLVATPDPGRIRNILKHRAMRHHLNWIKLTVGRKPQ